MGQTGRVSHYTHTHTERDRRKNTALTTSALWHSFRHCTGAQGAQQVNVMLNLCASMCVCVCVCVCVCRPTQLLQWQSSKRIPLLPDTPNTATSNNTPRIAAAAVTAADASCVTVALVSHNEPGTVTLFSIHGDPTCQSIPGLPQDRKIRSSMICQINLAISLQGRRISDPASVIFAPGPQGCTLVAAAAAGPGGSGGGGGGGGEAVHVLAFRQSGPAQWQDRPSHSYICEGRGVCHSLSVSPDGSKVESRHTHTHTHTHICTLSIYVYRDPAHC